MRPVAFLVESGSVLNASSLLFKDPGAAATVGTNGAVLRLEFPAECAGWFEFDSPDLARADLGGKLTSLLGEDFAYSNEPMPPNQPSPGVYRLEDTAQGGKPNPELFDGARVARIIAPASSTGKTWTITGARLVCQVRPANREGRFSSSDPQLTRAWYLGADTLRATMLADTLTSEVRRSSARRVRN